MMDIMQKGGVLMYPILFLSILALGIFFERLIYLNRSRFVPEDLVQRVKGLIARRQFSEAASAAAGSDSSIGRISAEVLNNIDLPTARLLEIAEETGRFEMSRIDRFLPTLQTIASISPLLGLLGTVTGMIKSFMVIASKGVGDANALAGGISEALLTTAAGLSVAIPAIVFFYIVRFRADKMALELEKAATDMMNSIIREVER